MKKFINEHPNLIALLISFFLLILLVVFSESIAKQLLNYKGDKYGSGITRNVFLKEHFAEMDMVMSPEKELISNQQISSESFIKQYRFRTDKHGFVMPPVMHEKPDMKIAFMGSSTTECKFVDEDKRFPFYSTRLLEGSTGKNINSINAGISGATSKHSLVIFTHKVVPLQPDFAVLMHNTTDLSSLIYDRKYPSLIVDEPSVFRMILKKLKRNFIDNTVTYIKSRISEDDYREKRERVDYDISEIKQEFIKNLSVFYYLCKVNHIKPVFMTHPSRFKKNPDQDIIERYNKISTLPYEQYQVVYKHMNSAVREFCEKNDVILIDLDKEMVDVNKYIYDEVHFNNDGSIKASEIIARILSKEIIDDH